MAKKAVANVWCDVWPHKLPLPLVAPGPEINLWESRRWQGGRTDRGWGCGGGGECLTGHRVYETLKEGVLAF